jgi:PmbA protein
VESILELAKKAADEAEVFVVTASETPVAFEANRLKALEAKESMSISLRVVRDGRIGLSSTSRLDNPQALVDMAVETAQFGAPAKFTLPPKTVYPEIEVYDPEMEGFSVDDMVEIGESLIARVREHTPELVCEAAVTRGIVTVDISNSRGGRSGYRKSFCTIGIEGTLIRDTDMLFVGEVDSSCHPLREFQPLVDSVIEQLELASRTAPAFTGRFPVILTPKGVRSAFFPPIAVAFNGKMVVEGASPLVGRQGKRLFDRRISLWDDATMDYRPASRPCDDEGVPSQRTALIEEGVVADFLYDLQTAAQAGARSTSSASRGRGSMPAPSVAALVVAEGDTSFEDMVRDIKEGLVVEELIGAGQGNILGGDFSGNVLLGYRVENGQMVGRVKDTMISGNIYDVLKKVAAVGDEAKWVGASLKSPALCLPDVSVVSKT